MLADAKCRLHHSLVQSVTELGNNTFTKVALGSKHGDKEFIALLLGVEHFLLTEEDDAFPIFGTHTILGPQHYARVHLPSIKSQIEDRGSWKLLYQDDGKPAHEPKLQLLLESWLGSWHFDFDVSVDPQANHGAGAVDICLSRGTEAVCIEFKRGEHSNLEAGLAKQLPKYMRAKGAEIGHYFVIAQDGTDPTLIEKWLTHINKDDRITVWVADGRTQQSASKLR